MEIISKQKGFTLFEMVISILILSLIALAGGKILQVSFNAYNQNQAITNANAQARLALERLRRDIHNVNSKNDFTTATASQLVFRDVYGTTITYSISGTQLLRNSQVLADGIVSANSSFSYLNSSLNTASSLSTIRYVVINLALNQGGVSYALETIVNTLNFT